MLTDGRGVPVAGVLDGANRNDHKLMHEALDAIALPRPKTMPGRPQHLCLDKGYDYAEPREIAAEFGFTLHLRTRGEDVAAKRHAGARAQVGGRAHTFLGQPFPRRPDPMEQEAQKLPRPAPLRLRHHRVATRPTGIGS